MGRRSDHSRSELREMICEMAERTLKANTESAEKLKR